MTPPQPQPGNQPGQVIISGEAQVGKTLTATVSDADGVPDSGITYRWLAGGQEIGTGKTYTVTAADKGKTITVEAHYTDKAGHQEDVTSNPTDAVSEAPVIPGNHAPTGEVSISGEAKVGETLSASNTLADEDGLGPVTYRWYANGQEIGTGASYTLTAADKGKVITVKAEYTDGKGTAESVESSPTKAVEDVTPPLEPPTFHTGIGQTGDAFTVTPALGATKMVIEYLDEGTPPVKHTVTVSKDAVTGKWSADDGSYVDDDTGQIRFEPDQVKDESTVTAINSNTTQTSVIAEIKTGLDKNEGPPERPEVKEGEEQGSVDITPNERTDSLYISYVDEATGAVKSITVHKTNGVWALEGTPVDGITVDPATGKTTLAAKVVQDSSTVSISAISNHSIYPTELDFEAGRNLPVYGDPEKPSLEKGADTEQGAVTIKPQGNTDKVVITYKDEDGTEHTITVSKDGNNKWTATGQPDNQGITVDEASGIVKLPPNAILDESDVTAIAYNGTNPNTATNTIKSDIDATTPSTTQAWLEGDATVTEGRDATYTIKLNEPAQENVTLTVKVTHVSTTDGDISYNVNTVTIAKGAQEATFTITAVDDTSVEDKESYRVEISDVAGATLDSARSSVVTEIEDNDAPPPATNHAPTDITLDTLQVMEGKVGAEIGKLTTTDEDAGDTHTYTVSDERFEVVNGTLKLKAGEYLNSATEQTVTLKVTTTDNHGAAFTKDITLQVLDDPNFPATSANAKGGTSFTTNSGIPQVGETLTASIFDGDGIDHSVPKYTWFVDGSEVGQGETYVVKASDAGKRIKVRAEYIDDAGHIENVESFAALVGGKPNPPAQNHAPTDISLDATQVMEGKEGAEIGKLTATDEDKGDTHTYTVSDSRFEVVDGTLKLKAGEKLDFGREPTVKLTVTANDGHGGTFEKEFTLQVQDDPNYPAAPQPPQNHAPTDISLDATQVMEGKEGAEIGKLITTDEDKGDTHTYTVSDSRFEVVDGTLKLKAGEKLDFDKEPTVKLTVMANDGHGGTFEKEFTLQVQDDPNYPPVTDNGSVTISGTAKIGETLTATVTDPDGVEESTIRYQWLANGKPIAQATGKTYTLLPTDIGKTITVKAEYDDKIRHHETPTSDATDKVQGDGVEPTVSLFGPKQLPEGGKTTYTAMLDKATDHDVTVNLDLNYYSGGAKLGSLHLSAKQVTIPAGETRGTFTVSSDNDYIVNDLPGDPTAGIFGIEMTSATGAKINAAENEFKGHVIDDEAPLPNITIHGEKTSLLEGETATYIVSLSHATDHPVTVDIDFVPFARGIEVKDASESDVTLSKKQITIPAGETKATFTVTAHDDGVAEGVEGFSLTLRNPEGALLDHNTDLSGTKNETVYNTIADKDGEPVVQLIGKDTDVREGESVTYTLQMSKPTDHDVSVTIDISPPSVDGAQKTVVIPKGQTSTEFTVTTADDSVAQSYRSAHMVSIKSANGAKGILDVHHRIGVLDNDPPVKPTITRNEQTGEVTVTSGMDLNNPVNKSSMNALVFMQVRFTDPSGQEYKLIMRKNMRSGETEWGFDEQHTISPASGITLNTKTGALTIPAHMLQEGSEVSAQNFNDSYGSATSEAATLQTGHAPQAPLFAPEQPVLMHHNDIAEVHHTADTHTADVQHDADNSVGAHNADTTLHLSPEIDVADYSQLVNMDSENILNYLGEHSTEILAKSASHNGQQIPHGSDGNDLFVAAHGAHLFEGGKGADTFAFLFDGNDGHADKILDFNPAEGDRIIFAGEQLAGAKVELSNDENGQHLNITDNTGKTQTVDIATGDGKAISEKDILSHVEIRGPQAYSEPAYSNHHSTHTEDELNSHNHIL